MSQPAIIDKILNSLGIFNESKMHEIPWKHFLTKDENGDRRTQEWHYHSVIGKINYLSVTTRPYIMLPVHKCANYIIDPKQSHKKLLKGLDFI